MSKCEYIFLRANKITLDCFTNCRRGIPFHFFKIFLNFNILILFPNINWRRFYGGCTPPSFTNILDFWLPSSRYEKDFFASVYLNYVRRLSSKEVFFSDILATTSRLNTLHGLETGYVQSDDGKILEKSFKTYPTFLTYIGRHQCQTFRSFYSFWLQQVSLSV